MRTSLVLRRRSVRAAGFALLLLPGCAFSFGTKHWNGDHAGGHSWTHYGWTSDDEAEGVADAAELDSRIAELEHRLDMLERHLHHKAPQQQGSAAPQPPKITQPAPPQQPASPPAPQPPQPH
ncbi:MAG TPA: hypothetical protein VK824_07600 [Planctomycetota bacterium]|nr:hypothetical protein [Planctomycetota bacterium]